MQFFSDSISIQIGDSEVGFCIMNDVLTSSYIHMATGKRIFCINEFVWNVVH